MEKFKGIFRKALFVILLLGTLWFCWMNRVILAGVFHLPLPNLLLILLAYFCFNLLTAWMGCLLLRHRGRVVPVMQVLAINSYASLLAQFTVRLAGYSAGKSALFRSQLQIPVNLTLGLMSFLTLIVIFSNSALGLLTGLWARIADGLMVPALYWLVFSATLLLCISIVLGIFRLGGVRKLPRNLQIWVANLHAVCLPTNFREVLMMIGLVILTVPVQVAALYLLFSGFGQPLPLVYLVFIAIFSSFSLMVSVVPGNLGIKEVVMWVLVAHLDISAASMISIMLIDRLLQLLLLAVFSMGAHSKLRRDAQPPVQAGI